MIFGNIGDVLSKLKKAQEDLKKVQEELKGESYEGLAGGVACRVSGDMEIKEIKIDPKIVNPKEVEKLERLVKEAVGSALSEAKDVAASKLKKVTGGLSIPGLF